MGVIYKATDYVYQQIDFWSIKQLGVIDNLDIHDVVHGLKMVESHDMVLQIWYF